MGLWRSSLVVASSILAWLTAASILLHLYGTQFRECRVTADTVVVVLGCRPTLLADRASHAARLASRPRAVVFSGAFGESLLGRQHFEKAFSSSSSSSSHTSSSFSLPLLLEESRSRTTRQNALYTKDLLQKSDIDSSQLLVVTDPFHAFRAGRLFRSVFPKSNVEMCTTEQHRPLLHLAWSLRELGGLVKYVFEEIVRKV